MTLEDTQMPMASSTQHEPLTHPLSFLIDHEAERIFTSLSVEAAAIHEVTVCYWFISYV